MKYVEYGCRFIVGDNGTGRWCGLPELDGSPYCPEHHALCHISGGSAAETLEIKRFERVAAAVGGKISKALIGPSEKFLIALERKSQIGVTNRRLP